ncbi:hypothetical protein ABZ135_18385 [Streptomyces sp. NPDC006339]|uniref:hypothetical protein n=1 Tax=Streptomyces sp. NPDC006339 TaxID=3156755 RepID=UPI0033A1D259
MTAPHLTARPAPTRPGLSSSLEATVPERHPAVANVLRFFDHSHLPPRLAEVSRPFGELAHDLADRPGLDGPELTTALRRLLDAKDAAVRAALPTGKDTA